MGVLSFSFCGFLLIVLQFALCCRKKKVAKVKPLLRPPIQQTLATQNAAQTPTITTPGGVPNTAPEPLSLKTPCSPESEKKQHPKSMTARDEEVAVQKPKAPRQKPSTNEKIRTALSHTKGKKPKESKKKEKPNEKKSSNIEGRVNLSAKDPDDEESDTTVRGVKSLSADPNLPPSEE